MLQLNTPLNDDELDRLDDFLLDRIPDDELDAQPGALDEGILDISELDGFLTAIISGPLALTPAQWLPVVWGAFEPNWASAAESEAMLSLILRHMNGIVNTLMEQPEAFEPIVLVREVDEQNITIVDEWCGGYMKGIALAAEAWRTGGEEVAEYLFPITVFSSDAGRKRLASLEGEEIEILKRSIPAAVKKIHAFWLERRSQTGAQHQPFVHDTPQLGRNEPCYCGSGKKFKKCCLH